MDAVEFLKQLKRRSESRPDYYGEELSIAYINPESLVAQVEQWAKENPVKTRQSEFLKIFPNVAIDATGTIAILPCTVDKTQERDCNPSCTNCRREYWAQEVE